MEPSHDDQHKNQFIQMIRESVLALCKSGLIDGGVAQVDGLIGITMTSRDVFLINIREDISIETKDGAFPNARRYLVPDNPSDGETETTNRQFSDLPFYNSTPLRDQSLGRQSYNNLDQDLTYFSSPRFSSRGQRPVGRGQGKRQQLQKKSKSRFSSAQTTSNDAQLTSRSITKSRNESCDVKIKKETENSSDPEILEYTNDRVKCEDGDQESFEGANKMNDMSSQELPPPRSSSQGHSLLSLESMSKMCDVRNDKYFTPPSRAHSATTVSKSNKSHDALLTIPESNWPTTAASGDDGNDAVQFGETCADDRPYVCKLCGASFSKKFCLANHIVTIHQVGGKYVCVHCGKQFLQKLRYLTHVDRHNNVRRHVCTACGRAFSYKYSLWSHAKKCAGGGGDDINDAE